MLMFKQRHMGVLSHYGTHLPFKANTNYTNKKVEVISEQKKASALNLVSFKEHVFSCVGIFGIYGHVQSIGPPGGNLSF